MKNYSIISSKVAEKTRVVYNMKNNSIFSSKVAEKTRVV